MNQNEKSRDNHQNEKKRHPTDPRSNVEKIGKYREELYEIQNVPLTVLTSEALLPGKPPSLTQRNVAKYLVPLTEELNEIPPSPIIDELPDAVINKMVEKDKAFWVDKPGLNDYTLHEAIHNYGLTTVKVRPPHQAVFPRSYQYDLDCVKYRRLHACDGLWQTGSDEQKNKPLSLVCRDCTNKNASLPPVQQWAKDPGNKRWRDYPDVSSSISPEDLKKGMMELTYSSHVTCTGSSHFCSEAPGVGRPFRNEACNWYNKHYPTIKHDILIRKFAN